MKDFSIKLYACKIVDFNPKLPYEIFDFVSHIVLVDLKHTQRAGHFFVRKMISCDTIFLHEDSTKFNLRAESLLRVKMA